MASTLSQNLVEELDLIISFLNLENIPEGDYSKYFIDLYSIDFHMSYFLFPNHKYIFHRYLSLLKDGFKNPNESFSFHDEKLIHEFRELRKQFLNSYKRFDNEPVLDVAEFHYELFGNYGDKLEHMKKLISCLKKEKKFAKEIKDFLLILNEEFNFEEICSKFLTSYNSKTKEEKLEFISTIVTWFNEFFTSFEEDIMFIHKNIHTEESRLKISNFLNKLNESSLPKKLISLFV